jgi:hypothetical protein
MMQILIATALLIAFGAYLLIQFWSSGLDDESSAAGPDSAASSSVEEGSERLKAA